jgi:hypothetical protein
MGRRCTGTAVQYEEGSANPEQAGSTDGRMYAQSYWD